jgi:energy-coupling factor transporter ATP-binding protein EcfA2
MNSTPAVPQRLRDAWDDGAWRDGYDELVEARNTALPDLLACLGRFLKGETGLAEFVKESNDFAFAEQHWGFKGFAQMQLNQYAKVATGANLVPDVEASLRSGLPAPADENAARAALQTVLEMTERLVDEATRLGVGKPAPGRVPLIISYFWEAQDRERWPIAYRASRESLAGFGLYHESPDPLESYMALRNVIIELGRTLGGTIWEIEQLLWSLRPQKKAPEQPPTPVTPKASEPSAQATLDDVYASYRNQGLIFPDELITSFLLSLWTKPFVILTGISGTGKTRIAQALAQALEPGTADGAVEPELEPGDEQRASFRVTDWSLRSGRFYVGADQVPAFDVPERGGSVHIAASLPDGAKGTMRLNNIDLSGTTRALRLLFADTATRRWLVAHANPGDVLTLDFDAAHEARMSLVQHQGATEARRRLLVPVRADWSDPRGLLGFWNPITSSYERTRCVDLLLRAKKDPDQPYFLILDEMNLARVEYYFSDFLSAMESKESIPLYSEDMVDETVPATLSFPSNVFVIGTVNIDETTHAFSPKVLDRASVIEFNDVLILDKLAGSGSGSTAIQAHGGFRLTNAELNVHRFRAADETVRNALGAELVDSGPTYSERLVNLHGLLERYTLHFGYRVIDEITTFVALARKSVGDDDATLTIAFDLAICQKILPKLTGGRELDEPLRRLLAFLLDPDDFGGDRWQDSEQRWDKANEASHHGSVSNVVYPRAARKAARMLRRLDETGFVSFLE